jgi:hypothetical protein
MKEFDTMMKFFTTKLQTEYIIIFKDSKIPSLKLFVDIQVNKSNEEIIKEYIISKYKNVKYNAIRIDELESARLRKE